MWNQFFLCLCLSFLTLVAKPSPLSSLLLKICCQVLSPQLSILCQVIISVHSINFSLKLLALKKAISHIRKSHRNSHYLMSASWAVLAGKVSSWRSLMQVPCEKTVLVSCYDQLFGGAVKSLILDHFGLAQKHQLIGQGRDVQQISFCWIFPCVSCLWFNLHYLYLYTITS